MRDRRNACLSTPPKSAMPERVLLHGAFIMLNWKSIQVAIMMGDDLDASTVFRGYTDGEQWNGWATPAFTREEGQRIATWTNALAERLPEDTVERVWWDEERQAFIMEDPSYPHVRGEPIPDEDIVSGFRCVEVDQRLFRIGTYKWTWEEVADSQVAVAGK